MSRGVSVPSGAQIVAYRELEEYELESFDEVVDDVRESVKATWPSMVQDDKWIGREEHVIASNSLAAIGISQYGPVLATWAIPLHEYVKWMPPRECGLADYWLDQIAPTFMKMFATMYHLDTMSNGASVYRRITQ